MFNRIRKFMKDNNGFTLIELIVVVAILGVLAGIATPNIIGAIKTSRINADLTNAATIANAIKVGLAEAKITSGTSDGTSNIEKLDRSSGIGAAIINNHYLDAIPTPKAADGLSFYVSVDATTGEVKVYAGNSNLTSLNPDDSDIVELYPESKIGSDAKVDAYK